MVRWLLSNERAIEIISRLVVVERTDIVSSAPPIELLK